MRDRDKQTHPRKRGRLRVRFGIDKLDRTAFTMNVSLTGAFIRTNAVYPPGKTIKLEFDFTDQSLPLFARVIWAKKVPPQMAHLLHCGMGVRFVDPSPEWCAAFEAWCSGK